MYGTACVHGDNISELLKDFTDLKAGEIGGEEYQKEEGDWLRASKPDCPTELGVNSY